MNANKDQSWSRLKTAFGTPKCRSKPLPLRSTSTPNRKSASKHQQSKNAVQLVPLKCSLNVRSPESSVLNISDDSESSKENLSVSEQIIDDEDDVSIDIDPDVDGHRPNGGFDKTPTRRTPKSLPVFTTSKPSTTPSTLGLNMSNQKRRRMDFANIFTPSAGTETFRIEELPSTKSSLDNIGVISATPEHHHSIASNRQLDSFHISDDDEADTHERFTQDHNGNVIPSPQPTQSCWIDETSSSNSTVGLASTLHKSCENTQHLSNTIGQNSQSSASTSTPLSGLHWSTAAGRTQRPRAGGLLEQLQKIVQRAQSSVAFWQHERRAGLVEAGSTVLVLEVLTAWTTHQQQPNAGGRAIRVRELIEDHAVASAEQQKQQQQMILLLDGGLKLCGRLAVGMRLEVDLRMATRLTLASTPSVVYPNVQFAREIHPTVGENVESNSYT